MIAKMVIRKHFEKKGLITSFIPKPNEAMGTGAHAHLSLWKCDGKNLPSNISGDEFSLYNMSEAFQSFTAGILHHYQALAQFMAPHHNSLRRII